MHEDRIKIIIGKFLKVSPDLIKDDTIIDSSVLKGSVLFHRMISRINDACNVEIEDYASIKNYADIIKNIEKNK